MGSFRKLRVAMAVVVLMAALAGPAPRAEASGLLVFAATTELMQVMIPWRSGDWLDLFADTLGVGLGLAIAATPLGRVLQWIEGLMAGAR